MMYQAERERLETMHRAIKAHLTQGIIPFWSDRAEDPEFGGYLTSFDGGGNAQDASEKYLNTQCRLVWWFSHLHRRNPEVRRYRELADAGVDFLLKHFWDGQHGGWFWKTHRDGRCLDDAKIVYGQSFAIYAMTEYGVATGDTRGLTFASETFDLLQKYAADMLRGGYIENLDRHWRPLPAGKDGGDRKTLDTHMHLLESFTSLYEASGESVHRRRLLEVSELILQRLIDPDTGCGLNHVTLDFRPIPAMALNRTWNAERAANASAASADTTSYGHNLELSWLLRRGLDAACVDLEPYRRPMWRLIHHALRHGVDWEFGGIYRDGKRDGGPLVLEKEFWQHAEALVGFLDGYDLFDDARCLDAFENLWEFVDKHMIAHGAGEWRVLLARDGSPIDDSLGNAWKVSYHTGRAMIECERRLSVMLQRKSAPGLEAVMA